jgi:hypothetical protein
MNVFVFFIQGLVGQELFSLHIGLDSHEHIS